jgi:hypothetical protein
MGRGFAVLVVFVVAAAGRADEADDKLAKQLTTVVRDPRLTTAQRVEAARTLGRLENRAAAAVPDLILQLDRLRGAEQEPLQEAVIAALGRIGSPAREGLPAMARAKGRSVDIDLAIRQATDQILAASDSQDVLALTKQLLSSDSSVRLRAVKALGNLGPAARFAVPDLTTTLADRDPDIRRASVAALRAINPEAAASESVVRSIALDLRDADPAARLLAVRALARFGRRAAIVIDDLQPLLTDPDPDVRRAVADAISRVSP